MRRTILPFAVRINTLFQHSEKYRNLRESPVTPSFRCLIHELNELNIWSVSPAGGERFCGSSG